MLIHWRLTPLFQAFANKLLDLAGFKNHWQAVHDKLNSLIFLKLPAPQNEELFVEGCRIDGQTLFFSDPSYISGLGDAVWRMENDYYLSQTAVFRKGDTVVDVGAHVGVFSIGLAKKYPFIKVYAIEPDPVKYGCLMRNIELNGVTNIVAINKAVSEDGREKRLYTSPWDTGWATIKASLAASQRFLRTVQVESVTLERLFQEYEIRHCRLLKITALGATYESLKGFKRNGCVDLLCGEVHLEECSRSKLELESKRIARQHFWRTIARQANGTVYSWLHQMPTTIERLPFKTSSIASII
jgi:FkbM family methyltransferase